MIEHPEPPSEIDYAELPLFSAFIRTSSGRRVASAFILRRDISLQPWGRYYSHAYVVTAMHAVFDKQLGEFREGLFLEFPWMGGQGLARQPLAGSNWEIMRLEGLPDGETVLDMAIAPLRASPFSGVQIGRSMRAIHVDDLDGPPETRLLGRQTVSTGLFTSFNGDDRHIDPILRFGRVAVVPQVPVGYAYGFTASVLVESSSAEGMSGAPVFTLSPGGLWSLLGVHVGHYTAAKKTTAAQDRVDVHSQIGIVAPAWRIHELLELPSLGARRAHVEAEMERYPWRFLDRRHRELRGVTLAEAYFADMLEYEEESGQSPFVYLFYQVADEYDELFGSGAELEWNTHTVVPLGQRARIVQRFEAMAGPTDWYLNEERLWRGFSSIGGGEVGVDLFCSAGGDVLALVLRGIDDALGASLLADVAVQLDIEPARIIDLFNTREV